MSDAGPPLKVTIRHRRPLPERESIQAMAVRLGLELMIFERDDDPVLTKGQRFYAVIRLDGRAADLEGWYQAASDGAMPEDAVRALAVAIAGHTISFGSLGTAADIRRVDVAKDLFFDEAWGLKERP